MKRKKKLEEKHFKNSEKDVTDNNFFWNLRQQWKNNLNWKSGNSYEWQSENLRDFFANIIKILGVPKFNQTESVSDYINDHTSKAVLKVWSSIKSLKGKCKNNSLFILSSCIGRYKEVGNLDTPKTSQDNDILTKIIKGNRDIFSSFVFQSLVTQ